MAVVHITGSGRVSGACWLWVMVAGTLTPVLDGKQSKNCG